MNEPSAVLVFSQDGDFMVFLSVDDAAGWVEAIDVEDGEYIEPNVWGQHR